MTSLADVVTGHVAYLERVRPKRVSPGKSKHHFDFRYPLCLLSQIASANDLRLLIAYSLFNRERIPRERQHYKVTKDKTWQYNAGEIMQRIHLPFDFSTAQTLAEQAAELVTDFREAYPEKWPSDVVHHHDVLLDAYHGDLPLPHYLVYAAILSCFSTNRPKPIYISVSRIQHRVCGYSRRAAYDQALADERVTVRLTYWQIRRITRELVNLGLIERYTYKSRTWYATRYIMRRCYVTNLAEYARGVALHRAQARLHELEVQAKNLELDKAADSEIAAIQRQITAERDRQKILRSASTQLAIVSVEDIQTQHGFKLYDRSKVSQTAMAGIRHTVVTPAGDILVCLQPLPSNVITQLAQAGCRVQDCARVPV